MSERKLATIRRIDALNPIEGADKIEVATVGGWKVVCQKGLYDAGDLVIYCEIDSWIPTEVAPFLTKEGQEPREYNGVKGERLRTVKLRGQISQGLLLPLSAFDFHSGSLKEFWFYETPKEGDDCTEILGIQKYDPPIPACLAGEVKGLFPSFIPKTDEERIQNLADEWEDMKKLEWYVTEKVDGTSFTCYIKGDEFGVCSRNLELRENESNTHWKFVRQMDIEAKMRKLHYNHGNIDFAIQGELLGEGIQGNKYKLKGQKVLVFNAYNITDGSFFGWEAVVDICKELGIEVVPTIDDHFHFDENATIESVLSMAESKSVLNPNIEREGIVFKTYAREKSFKAISNKFLLKGGE